MEHSSSSGRSRGRKKKGVPWLWILGGLVLLIVLACWRVDPGKVQESSSDVASGSGKTAAQSFKESPSAGLKAGAVVDVTSSFASLGKPPQNIKEGWRGTVAKLDADGDALVDFPKLDKRVWVDQKHFDKLKVDTDAQAGDSGTGSTLHFLKLALRLKELTELATKLHDAEELTPEVAEAFNVELTDMEGEIKAGEGIAEATTIRDLLSMASVIRGMTLQHSQNLTDEEVEALNGSTYSNPRYWDDYYNKTNNKESYDWYGSWDSELAPVRNLPAETKDLADMLKLYVQKEHRILNFGCGNSDLSEKMYRNGYHNIVNMDVSQSLIDGLKERLGAEMPKMQWLTMSGAVMTFGDEEFDIILDKGTLDAMESNSKLIAASVKELHRTLKSTGLLISITFRDEVVRVQQQLQESAAWADCVHHVFERTNEASAHIYHVHACKKN